MGGNLSREGFHEKRDLGRQVDLTINGVQYKVSDDVPADTTLNKFIRDYAHLKGTKFMCLEGGCGACLVAVKSIHPLTQKTKTYAVNSCLVPIFACQGWSVTTIEGLGNKENGYHQISKRLAAANGTQCGYCSPGMVMNMYSLLESNPKITMKEVENSFGSNICRCTGYRPILEAFKSMASDAPSQLQTKLQDLEDLSCWGNKDCGPCDGGSCPGPCHRLPDTDHDRLYLSLQNGSSWFRPANKKEVFEILDMAGDKSYRFVAGNTGHGVYRITSEPDIYIDVNGVPELQVTETNSEGIILGANVKISEAMEFLNKTAKESPKTFSYCRTLVDHLDLVAGIPIRNAGTIAGNLYLKHSHREFPSDIFLIFEMVGAQVTIAESSGIESRVGLPEFLTIDLNRKLITSIILPALDNQYTVRSFKVMHRAQNAHAIVNAGFRFKLDSKTHTVLEKPTILFGGINENFLHASKTEDYLKGKKLLNEGTLKGALEVLESELKPDHNLPDTSPEYRRGLALSLLYKFFLMVSPKEINEKYRSGGTIFDRPVSNAKQEFDTDAKLWPLNKPMPKMEALMQCSGETEYINDIPQVPGQLWAQLVLCDRAKALIIKIDPSEALKMDGVVSFLSAEDIPGKNNFYPRTLLFVENEMVFAEGRTNYAGEAVGVIVAKTFELAIKAAKKVKIEYSDQIKPILDGRKIIDENIAERISPGPKGLEPVSQGKDVKFKISGKVNIAPQYHFMMETFTCLSVPKENEIDVYPSTQWPTTISESVSQVLKLPQNKINIQVRRIGGAYGAKLTRSCHSASVASLAALKLQKPVNLSLNIETNMEWMGKRQPVYANYEIGVDDKGLIQFMNMKVYQDNGWNGNDTSLILTPHHIINCYDASNWSIELYNLKTDTASNTWCRAPSSTEGICIIEYVMEHIANAIGKDPLEVRLANMKKGDSPLPDLITELKKLSDYDKRSADVRDFNQKNRWKKRGISLVPMDFPLIYYSYFNAIVSIFGLDGSVCITHGAVEMGQGLNTKVVQVAAHTLGVDVWKISTKPLNNNVTPNNSSTGGSIGSESICFAVKNCCEELNKRLEPIKKELGDKATWEDIIKKAYFSLVDLQATSRQQPWDLKPYSIYGVIVIEVEIDVLTGQYHTRRIDLLEDAGISMNPDIDIGQIEGAIVMGLGFYTTEEVVYNPDTGKVLTNRTWNYKPLGAKDIPIDWRIHLRKNAPNSGGVLGSKGTGEPPLCLSVAVTFALRNAVESARKDAGIKQEAWFDLDHPITPERTWLGCLTKKEHFKLQ